MAGKFVNKLFQAALLAVTGYEIGSKVSEKKEVFPANSSVQTIQTTDSSETLIILAIIIIVFLLLLVMAKLCQCFLQFSRAVDNRNNEA